MSDGTSSDPLAPFERDTLSGDYKIYFTTKRENFRASVYNLPLLWQSFQHLDEIWIRELVDTQQIKDPNVALPAALFRDAHARFRIAMELAFSCCMHEAFNSLRLGIEGVYHACKILSDPKQTEQRARVWIATAERTPEAKKAFAAAFEHNKMRSFAECGLSVLHRYWQDFSRYSHSSMDSFSIRLESVKTATGITWNVHYFEGRPPNIAGTLFWLLLASAEMEKAFFDRFRARLDLDPSLADLRRCFEATKEAARQDIIRRFNWKPPNSVPTPEFSVIAKECAKDH
jgi:hypothetical protein